MDLVFEFTNKNFKNTYFSGFSERDSILNTRSLKTHQIFMYLCSIIVVGKCAGQHYLRPHMPAEIQPMH